MFRPIGLEAVSPRFGNRDQFRAFLVRVLRANLFIIGIQLIQILAAHHFILGQQAAAYGHAARRVWHPHRRAIGIARCDFYRRMRARRGGPANQQRQGEALALHFARHIAHFFQRRRDQARQANDVHLLGNGRIQNFLARHHHAHVDDFVVIALKHHGHDILAYVVHITLDRGNNDLALGLGRFARLARHARLFFLDKRNQVRHGLLHHPRGFHHLRQKHFARAKQIADDIHAIHQRAFNYMDRAPTGLHQFEAHFFGVFGNPLRNAMHQSVSEAFFH